MLPSLISVFQLKHAIVTVIKKVNKKTVGLLLVPTVGEYRLRFLFSCERLFVLFSPKNGHTDPLDLWGINEES